ncbi:MAG: class I SAM-dependent rRNA methyltransferase [Lentisphaerae bacterium]|nr:class I SAM-dependent rRNA methyltransferase [Lentisphaerota bacterium]
MANIAIRLNQKAALAVRKGHPWVFSDSILKLSKEGTHGDTAIAFDQSGKHWLGAGLYDPESPVRVRILTIKRNDPPVGKELFRTLLKRALERRLDHVPPETDAWRIINGESDSFSGVVADKYADHAVLKIYSAAWIPHVQALRELLVEEVPGVKETVLRFSRELRKYPECVEEGNSEPVTFLENGIRFQADLLHGQKTGFFLDQRDNRAEVKTLSKGKKVLNVFSFSGGFSLSAAKGGAEKVVSVDADGHALEACDLHFKMNSDCPEIAACSHEELKGDAFELMRGLIEKKERFDIVIVDPPSFAKSKAEVSTALNTYSRLAALAVKLCVPKGTLVFASCSSRVYADELFERVKTAASAAGRPIREWKRTAHAFDHPALFAESSYLKCMYAEVR